MEIMFCASSQPHRGHGVCGVWPLESRDVTCVCGPLRHKGLLCVHSFELTALLEGQGRGNQPHLAREETEVQSQVGELLERQVLAKSWLVAGLRPLPPVHSVSWSDLGPPISLNCAPRPLLTPPNTTLTNPVSLLQSSMARGAGNTAFQSAALSVLTG